MNDIIEKAEDWFENNYSANAEITKVFIATHRPSNLVLDDELESINTRVYINYEFQGKGQFCEYLEVLR